MKVKDWFHNALFDNIYHHTEFEPNWYIKALLHTTGNTFVCLFCFALLCFVFFCFFLFALFSFVVLYFAFCFILLFFVCLLFVVVA